MITVAVILAAGRGSRLKEVTATRSKAMAPIAGAPMIGRVIDSLRDAGISTIIVVGAPHDHELRVYCETRAITYITQDEPRGSGDALMRCAGFLSSTFLVSACDSLVSSKHIAELLRTHEGGRSEATLSVMEVGDDVPLGARSVLSLEGNRVVDIIEKPAAHERVSNITSLPLYVFEPSIFSELSQVPMSSRGEYEVPAAIRAVISRGGQVQGVFASERFDLTDSRDLVALNSRFLDRQSPSVIIDASVVIPPSVSLVPPVLIEDGCKIGANVRIGPHVFLERGATVEEGACIERSVITRGAIARGSLRDVVVVAPPSVCVS